MAQRKPIVIDGLVTEVPVKASIADVVPPGIRSVVLADGKLVHREDFARTPVPEGFETNLSAINKGNKETSPCVAQPSAHGGRRHGHR